MYVRVRGVLEQFDSARVVRECRFVQFRFRAGIIRVAYRESLHLSFVRILSQASRRSPSALSLMVGSRKLAVHFHRESLQPRRLESGALK